MNELDMNNEKHRLRLPLTSFCKKKGEGHCASYGSWNASVFWRKELGDGE